MFIATLQSDIHPDTSDSVVESDIRSQLSASRYEREKPLREQWQANKHECLNILYKHYTSDQLRLMTIQRDALIDEGDPKKLRDHMTQLQSQFINLFVYG